MNLFISFKHKENITISAKRYHFDAKKHSRDIRRERLSQEFKDEELQNLHLYPAMTSQRGEFWFFYVEHRLEMCERGFDTYAKRKYVQIDLDKYIQSTRALDEITSRLSGNKPSLFFIGTGGQSACSPIRIRKHV